MGGDKVAGQLGVTESLANYRMEDGSLTGATSIVRVGGKVSEPTANGTVKKYPNVENAKFQVLEGLVAAPTARSSAPLNGFGSPPKAPQIAEGYFFTSP